MRASPLLDRELRTLADHVVQRTGVARSPVGVLGATSAVQQPGTTLIDIIEDTAARHPDAMTI